MSKLYKLQKGPTCTIRTDKAGVEDAIENGYVYIGECDEAYNIISADPPVFDRAAGPMKDDSEKASDRPARKPKAEKPED